MPGASWKASIASWPTPPSAEAPHSSEPGLDLAFCTKPPSVAGIEGCVISTIGELPIIETGTKSLIAS